MIDNGQTIDHEHYAYFAEDTPVEERIVQVKMMTSKEDNPSPFERGMQQFPDLSLTRTDRPKRSSRATDARINARPSV